MVRFHENEFLLSHPKIPVYTLFSLEILFDNLLKNAIKYSGKGTNIQISIKDHLNNVQVLVEDSGVGITKEHLDKVFLRFYRVKQHSETGSGLGLSIVKHITDLHEGDIQLMASDLGGLKVIITLPKGTHLDVNNA